MRRRVWRKEESSGLGSWLGSQSHGPVGVGGGVGGLEELDSEGDGEGVGAMEDGAGGVGVGLIGAEGRGAGVGRCWVVLVRGCVGIEGVGGEPSHANKQSKNSVLEIPIQRKRSCWVIGRGLVGG